MKILYVLHSTYALDGSSRSFRTLIAGVLQRGHTPVVVAPDGEGQAKILRDMGVEVLVVPYRNSTYPDLRDAKDWVLFLPRLIARRILIHRAVHTLCKQLRGKGINLVHTNTSVVEIGERIAQELAIPHVYHLREYDLDFHYYPCAKSFHRRLSHNYSVCITKAIQQHHLQAQNPRSVVVYNGITLAESKLEKGPSRYPLLPVCGTD